MWLICLLWVSRHRNANCRWHSLPLQVEAEKGYAWFQGIGQASPVRWGRPKSPSGLINTVWQFSWECWWMQCGAEGMGRALLHWQDVEATCYFPKHRPNPASSPTVSEQLYMADAGGPKQVKPQSYEQTSSSFSWFIFTPTYLTPPFP